VKAIPIAWMSPGSPARVKQSEIGVPSSVTGSGALRSARRTLSGVDLHATGTGLSSVVLHPVTIAAATIAVTHAQPRVAPPPLTRDADRAATRATARS